MAIKKPDFACSLGFFIGCPGHPNPDAEGRRLFREGVAELMVLLAEWIADSEVDFIVGGKETADETGFPFSVELDMDQGGQNYLLIVKAKKRTRQRWRR